MKKVKFTFKKRKKETGLASIGAGTPETVIKLWGKYVGAIYIRDSPLYSDEEGWRVKIQADNDKYPEESNCPWKWVQYKARFGTEEEAREWVQFNTEAIFNFLWHEHKTV